MKNLYDTSLSLNRDKVTDLQLICHFTPAMAELGFLELISR